MIQFFKQSFVLVVFIGCVGIQAQLTSNQSARIDSLFLDWNLPNHPGGAVAVMQGNQVVYSKAFGLASMEYLVPNTTGTRFNVASISKQFSALGIVILHLQGELSIDDTIDKYIDGLAPFGSEITIRHMLHHTSGLRSLHALFGLAGWRGDDTRTNADLDRIMAKQTELNFEPGSEYLYCNTGYMFLVNIIEKVTGTSFLDYMKNEVFIPLGMMDTYVEDAYDRIVHNNATSYKTTTDGFARSVEYWGYVGSGNMHTTTADLLTYLKNYYDPKPGWEQAFEMMQTLDPLTDGSPNDYAFGVVVDDYLGRRRVGHGGSIGGFRANIAVFPQEKTSIAITTNFSSAGPAGKSNQIAKVLFDEPTAKALKIVPVSKRKMESFAGLYLDGDTYTEREVVVEGDTLYFGNGNSAYVPIRDTSFVNTDPENASKIEFNNGQLTYYPESGKPMVFSKFQEEPLNPEIAKGYVGTYYSPEIETSYTIHFENGKLFAHHIRHGHLSLIERKQDLLEGASPLSHLKFNRENDKINGVWISNGRVRNLWFVKTK